MTPESNFNPLGLDAQSGAAMMRGASIPETEQVAPTPNPIEEKTRQVLENFHSSWSMLEKLNGDHSGDSEKFTNLQKAAESWIADIVTRIPESSGL
jgi:hypothetical protein